MATLRLAIILIICLIFTVWSAFGGLVPIEEVFEPGGSFDPNKFGKVAVVQWAPVATTPLGVTPAVAENFKVENRKALEVYIREAAAKGARLIITSEFAVVGYPDIPELPSEEDNFRNRQDIEPYVEPVPGPSTQYFGDLARELGIYLHVGFAEVEPETEHYYNTIVVLNPEGMIVARYRKINLYHLEQSFLEPGKDPVTYEGIFGKVGITVCSDIYSARPMDQYKQAGVHAVALSTSWAQWNTGMANFQRGARWINGYVLAANQPYFPDSGVINPDGSLQSHIRQTLRGIAYGYLPYIN
ncbi:MAG: carbon-nitrogen hydrolase family protein [Deltaproteobacteria bacterium]|nr:carbon-nitrogen hydrolase family protein [Deltaproteobacteria bacterium]